jgi:DNA repair exonuclease SbcCD ATPase subunit
MGKYFKTAFFNRWNLLAFLGGIVFALISGWPDVAGPVVLAGEIGYLSLLATHPKFRAYVDAQEAKATRAEGAQQSEQMLQHIIATLPRDLLDRYDALRSQCAELRHIALQLKRPGTAPAELPLEKFQIAGLDRLLWIYLRLLYTQCALSRFLEKTREKDIQSDVQRLEEQLGKLASAADPQTERMRKTLEDNLQTSRGRLANLAKARDNFQLVQLEIDRLENKIRSLSEMAVNRQEPEFISSQVDDVAASMLQTERTMNELTFFTGLDPVGEESPALLQTELEETKKPVRRAQNRGAG